jgi:hypothetical protein
MRLEHDAAGRPQPRYETGDLVRFRQDEIGPVVTAFAGEWGKVQRVEDGALDIQLAGYGRPRTAPLAMAVRVPARCVEPCDFRGVPLPLRSVPPLRKRAPPSPPPRRRRRLGAWVAGLAVLVAGLLAGLLLPRG